MSRLRLIILSEVQAQGIYPLILSLLRHLNSFTVTYDGNGATSGSAPIDGISSYEEGKSVTVLGNTGSLAKTGCTFSGWNTAADGSGTSYAAGATFTMGNCTGNPVRAVDSDKHWWKFWWTRFVQQQIYGYLQRQHKFFRSSS